MVVERVTTGSVAALVLGLLAVNLDIICKGEELAKFLDLWRQFGHLLLFLLNFPRDFVLLC